MKILTKLLGKGEINWKGFVIPRSKTALFPPVGVEFDLLDGKATFKGKMDSQSRIRLAEWFRQHRNLKAGDEVTFFKENGSMRITLSRSFSKPENQTFDWAHEVLDAVRNREINGIIRINGNGFNVEIGEHIKNTQIIFSAK